MIRFRNETGLFYCFLETALKCAVITYKKTVQAFSFLNENLLKLFPPWLTRDFRHEAKKRNLQLVLKKHGLKHIRFHDLRHSCASLLLANGVNLKEIDDLRRGQESPLSEQRVGCK